MKTSHSVYVRGLGAVSPAGWNVAALRDALAKPHPLPDQKSAAAQPLRTRTVPQPEPRPKILAHPRLRRSSAISHYAAAAAAEALAESGLEPHQVGVIFSTMCGSIRYTRKFYDEILDDPSTASPILFPETVFNAPASHVAAALVGNVPTYTLVGDSSIFLQALSVGAHWLHQGLVQASLIIAAEEMDGVVIDAWHHFSHEIVLAEGAAAVCLSLEPGTTPSPTLAAVTDAFPVNTHAGYSDAVRNVREQLSEPTAQHLLCDEEGGPSRCQAAEAAAYADWTGGRLSPKLKLGEAMSASTGWQCVAAIDHLRRLPWLGVDVLALGCNQHALGARFSRATA